MLWVLSQIALLAVLTVYARRGIAFLRESAAGPIGTGMLLGMLGIAIAWLVRIPFRAAGHWWDRRYGQTDLGYLDWLVEDWAVLAAGFVSLCLALLIVMGLARWLGDWWWIPGAGVFVGIAALFSFAFPYLDFGTTRPLKDPALVAAANNYERELGLPDISLRVEDVSDYTDLANAYAVGFGPTRRVVFWDTLLLPPFTEDEQKVVLAHELAHHGNRHLGEGIALVRDLRAARRLDPHARDARAGRHGDARGRSSGAPRGRDLQLAAHPPRTSSRSAPRRRRTGRRSS